MGYGKARMTREEPLTMPIGESVLWLRENVKFIVYTEGNTSGLTWVSGPFESESYFPDDEGDPRESTLSDFTTFVWITFPALVAAHSVEVA